MESKMGGGCLGEEMPQLALHCHLINTFKDQGFKKSIVCTWLHACTHTHTQSHTHTHTDTHTYTQTHTHTHTQTHKQTPLHTHTHVHTHARTHTHTHTHACTHTHTQTRRHTHTHRHTRTHIHTHTHPHKNRNRRSAEYADACCQNINQQSEPNINTSAGPAEKLNGFCGVEYASHSEASLLRPPKNLTHRFGPQMPRPAFFTQH